jgi:hypothetical protein
MTQEAQVESRGIALLIHNLSTIRGWMINNMPRSLYSSEEVPVPTAVEVCWAPRAV